MEWSCSSKLKTEQNTWYTAICACLQQNPVLNRILPFTFEWAAHVQKEATPLHQLATDAQLGSSHLYVIKKRSHQHLFPVSHEWTNCGECTLYTYFFMYPRLLPVRHSLQLWIYSSSIIVKSITTRVNTFKIVSHCTTPKCEDIIKTGMNLHYQKMWVHSGFVVLNFLLSVYLTFLSPARLLLWFRNVSSS